jgi:ATP-binding cassette subfamily F protein 3
MDSKDILKNALLQYTGTLILVSHDRDFLQGLTETLYEFRDGEVHEFRGDIFEFLESKENEKEAQIRTATQGVSSAAAKNTAGKEAYEQNKNRERELRKLRSAVEKIEKEIETLEAQIAEKESLLASGNAQDANFFAEYQSLKDRLDAQMEAWETATIAVEEYKG